MSKAKETLFKVVLHEPDWTSRLIEAIPDAIVIADTDGVVQYVNAGYLRLAGLKREDIIGKDLAEMRPGAILPHAIRSGEAKLAVYRRVGDTEYITDVSPIVPSPLEGAGKVCAQDQGIAVRGQSRLSGPL